MLSYLLGHGEAGFTEGHLLVYCFFRYPRFALGLMPS